MPAMRIVLDGDNAFPEMVGKVIHEVQNFAVSALPAGMESGKPSVAMIAELPDGSYVFAETSLVLFLTAADALRARYGDPR